MSLILNMEYDRQSMALVLDLTALPCCPPADGNRCVAQEKEAFLNSLNVIHGRSYSQIGMYIKNYIAYLVVLLLLPGYLGMQLEHAKIPDKLNEICNAAKRLIFLDRKNCFDLSQTDP